tara:strand:- start:21 stop:206 length:186 start_codon:yes stop_codon:yes gene_type:complete
MDKDNIKSVKKINHPDTGTLITYELVDVNDNMLSVPLDTDNTDYQAILEWVAEGNTIAEAD